MSTLENLRNNYHHIMNIMNTRKMFIKYLTTCEDTLLTTKKKEKEKRIGYKIGRMVVKPQKEA